MAYEEYSPHLDNSGIGYMLELCDEALESLRYLPPRAYAYQASCREKIESIAAWVTVNRRFTEAQQRAVRNMMAGAERWHNQSY